MTKAIAHQHQDYPRKTLFIAGAGRSGTSTLAGIVSLLGLHVPQPEVSADESNPKGFGEPAWVVEYHDRLLDEVAVTVSDSRPAAWLETGRIATRESERIAVAQWLGEHLDQAPELVVKDPRLGWFLGLWRIGSIRAGAVPVFATMLRPPAEVVGSKQKYYRNRLGSAHLAASWLNMLLHTERATRELVTDGGRAFVRYDDLLEDWVQVTMRLGETLGLQHVLHARSEAIRDVHRFVDPGLRRVSATLADLELPPRLHELTAETWVELNRLADPGGDTEEVRSTLDELREAYVRLYEESEAIARSTAVAARTLAARGQSPGRGSRAELIPHRVRAAIPAPVRRGLRRVLRRQR